MSLVGHLDHRQTPLDCFMTNWKTIRLAFAVILWLFAELSFARADLVTDFVSEICRYTFEVASKIVPLWLTILNFRANLILCVL